MPRTTPSSPTYKTHTCHGDLYAYTRVDAADLGLLVAPWGGAPRNEYPSSDCPLGLIP